MFFDSNDWLGRNDPSYFYNAEHIVFIVLAVLTCIFLPILLKKKSDKTFNIIMYCLLAFQIVIDLTKYINTWVNGFDIVWDLPLYTCSMSMYLWLLYFVIKKQSVKDAFASYLCSIGLFAGLINFFYNGTYYSNSLFSFAGLHCFLYHFIMVLMPMMLMISGRYKPNFKDFWKGTVVFACTSLPVIILDYVAKVDYMYFYTASGIPVLEGIAAKVPHFAWTIIMILIYVLIQLVVTSISIGIYKLCHLKKKEKDKNVEPVS